MLTSKQRARLRSMAQSYDPIVYIGKLGITDEIINQLENAINARELRDARFVCSIYFIYAEDDEYSVRGEVCGYIGDEPVGKNGFGYDPIFMLNDDESMATISDEEKNEISHRAMAFKKLTEILKEKFS